MEYIGLHEQKKYGVCLMVSVTFVKHFSEKRMTAQKSIWLMAHVSS